MNAFDNASIVETQALIDIVPFIQGIADDGRFVLTNKGNLAKELQKTVGDAALNSADGRIWGIEIKAEAENKYGNFFLETWSNRSRFTLGWMYTLHTDRLWYYFLAEKDLYCMDFRKLREWAFCQRRIYDFPEKSQGKRDQLNDTWGRCVPIPIIEREVGFNRWLKDQGQFRRAA